MYSGREIDSVLRKKGFLRVLDGDHIHYYFVSSDGKKSTIKTKISHGMDGSTVSVGLIVKMAGQLHLKKKQFLDLIDCRLSEDQYRKILRTQGFSV
jgi:hypothetical protein